MKTKAEDHVLLTWGSRWLCE